MASSYLTPSVITKESLMVLHQKCNFIGNVHRGYDDRFAKSGAKIGDTLKIRMPNEFVVRTGRVMDVQDTVERSIDLTVNNYYGVDINFDDDDLTLTVDDFRERYIEPAMSVLAAKMESLMLADVYKDVYNFHDGVSAANDFDNITEASRILSDYLAPPSQRCCIHTPRGMTDLVNSNKSLFQDSKSIASQYRDAQMGRFAGFDHYENTLIPSHTTGTAAEGDTAWNINNASTEFASAAEIASGIQTLTVDTGTTTIFAGDILTIANVYRVHPESKVSTGVLQQFVAVGDGTVGDPLESGGTSLQISPPIIVSGARQNCNAAAANTAAINKIGGGNAATWQQSLAFHKNAFAFATADLVLPKGVDFAAREVMDGISMRMVRDWDQTNASLSTRIDVLAGWVSLYPQHAVRIGHNS